MRRGLPSLNALVAFEAAGRLGRMTAAADELAVTHSAVSRQVKALEADLGTRLFEGPRSRLRLTSSGQVLLGELTESFDRIKRAVRTITDDETGPLDVSVLGTFTMRWLIPRLHRFQKAHPGVEVRLSASDQPVDFTRSSFEVAIRVGAGGWPREAVVTSLFDEQIGPVCAPSLLRTSSVKSPNDLEGLPLLHTKTRPNAWRDWASRAGGRAKSFSGQHFEHFYFLLEAAVAGLGVAIAPFQLVEEDLRAKRLVAPLGFVPSDQVYVALRRQGRSHKASVFVAWLKAEADAAPRAPGTRRR